jgi:hypothetical protein
MAIILNLFSEFEHGVNCRVEDGRHAGFAANIALEEKS